MKSKGQMWSPTLEQKESLAAIQQLCWKVLGGSGSQTEDKPAAHQGSKEGQQRAERHEQEPTQ